VNFNALGARATGQLGERVAGGGWGRTRVGEKNRQGFATE
jgi:hypothetical protein